MLFHKQTVKIWLFSSLKPWEYKNICLHWKREHIDMKLFRYIMTMSSPQKLGVKQSCSKWCWMKKQLEPFWIHTSIYVRQLAEVLFWVWNQVILKHICLEYLYLVVAMVFLPATLESRFQLVSDPLPLGHLES